MFFNAFAAFVLQSTVFVGTAWTLRLALRGRISAAARYRVLFAAVACLPLLAAATFVEVKPSARLDASEFRETDPRALSIDTAIFPSVSGRGPGPIRVPENVADCLVLAWAAVSAFLLFRTAAARVSMVRALRRLRACDDPAWRRAMETAAGRYGIRGKIVVLDGGDLPPFTAGLLGRKVVVPSGGGSCRHKEAVMLHEIAHVRRRDVPWMTYIEVIAALAWCVPFMARSVRALTEDREEACDAAAIEKGAQPSEYASLILDLAAVRRTTPSFGVSGMAGPTRAEVRIRNIMKAARRTKGTGVLGSSALALVLIAGFSIGGTGTLSGVFALGPAGSIRVRTISAGGILSTAEYPRALVPTESPVVGAWRVTLPFGRQKHPIAGDSYLHVGIDLANGRAGDPVRATIAGTVIAAGFAEGSGNTVTIGDGRVLARFSKLQDILVSVGDRIKPGKEIGTVGSTGVATGPHLHYEVWIDGQAVDPAALLLAGGAAFPGLGEE